MKKITEEDKLPKREHWKIPPQWCYCSFYSWKRSRHIWPDCGRHEPKPNPVEMHDNKDYQEWLNSEKNLSL